MLMRDWPGMIRRGLRKPPRVIVARMKAELRAELARFSASRYRHLKRAVLLKRLEAKSIDILWERLAQRPYFALCSSADLLHYDQLCPDSREKILVRAQDAAMHRVDLLGSGPVRLGSDIDWLKDFKTGLSWPARYFRDIEYTNLDRPSDVKIPWELSRLQWLIPAGQAYLLNGDERYAHKVRAILEHWIDNNPYAGTVNWACTMEVALRIFTWTWFFHVFNATPAWQDDGFREKFLRNLYLHVLFTENHIERSDVNGNHYTADAAGLVVGGLFFGEGVQAQHWTTMGWSILQEEIERQVYPDGVDFEASVPYHRLVTELLLLPALYRMKLGLPVGTNYRQRLESMAAFTAAYSKPDGSVPLLGDADDARVLPFGSQDINDHRYLVSLVAHASGSTVLPHDSEGSQEEVYWLLGPEILCVLPQSSASVQTVAFVHGGIFIMRNPCDHIFIDCGPLGLAGRGGHGHNDALSFEATLNGVNLITDSGAYVYTADYRMRNRFRSTASHNTPLIDGEEINRFIRPDYLWNLHDDAKPRMLLWQPGGDCDRFRGTHEGYARLPSPVTPLRSIELFHAIHKLRIVDEFTGDGEHDFEIPVHFAPGIEICVEHASSFQLRSKDRVFRLSWIAGGCWQVFIEETWISPGYGRRVASQKIVWRGRGKAHGMKLDVAIIPVTEAVIVA